MTNYSGIIFDMDGLMVNTEPLSRRAWSDLLAGFGFKLDDGVYGRMIGLRSDESARLVLDTYPLPLTAEEIIRRRRENYQRILTGGVPVMPGLMALVAEIRHRELPWGVATSSPRAHAERILTQMDLLEPCRALAGGDEVEQGKPAPDLYLLAARRLGIAPAACLALEDSAPGCRSAHAAGMRVIAIPNGQTRTANFSFVPFQFRSLNDVTANLDALLAG